MLQGPPSGFSGFRFLRGIRRPARWAGIVLLALRAGGALGFGAGIEDRPSTIIAAGGERVEQGSLCSPPAPFEPYGPKMPDGAPNPVGPKLVDEPVRDDRFSFGKLRCW